MSLIEFIGFMISLVAFIVLGYKRVKEDQRRKENPLAYDQEEHEKQKKLKEFLRSLEVDMEDDEEEELPPPRPPPRPQPQPIKKTPKPPPKSATMTDFSFKTNIENRKSKTAIDQNTFNASLDERYKDSHWEKKVNASTRHLAAPSYEVQTKHNASYAEKVLKSGPSLKHMIIYQTILGSPRGLSPWK